MNPGETREGARPQGTNAVGWIDLNADVGEDPGRLADGREAALMAHLSSVNVACGGHAGDAESMRAVVRLARTLGLSVGAHPSYPDRAGFGRRALALTPDEIRRSVAAQVRALAAICEAEGVALAHCKPHGALYHAAAGDARVASAIADGVRAVGSRVILVGMGGPAGATGNRAYRDAGCAVWEEAFADRTYEADGRLRARSEPGALRSDPAAAAAQALTLAGQGCVISATGARLALQAQTICVHSDTPGAEQIAQAVATALLDAGWLRRAGR